MAGKSNLEKTFFGQNKSKEPMKAETKADDLGNSNSKEPTKAETKADDLGNSSSKEPTKAEIKADDLSNSKSKKPTKVDTKADDLSNSKSKEPTKADTKAENVDNSNIDNHNSMTNILESYKIYYPNKDKDLKKIQLVLPQDLYSDLDILKSLLSQKSFNDFVCNILSTFTCSQKEIVDKYKEFLKTLKISH